MDLRLLWELLPFLGYCSVEKKKKSAKPPCEAPVWAESLFCCEGLLFPLQLCPPLPGSAAMDPLPTPGLQRLACVLLVMLTSLPASALESETCFSRQHRGATVALQPALNRTAVAAMDSRLVHSERDCVLACCSEEVRPGARCNMVLFNGKKAAGEENCFLFHCDGEQDCPLMKAQDGINTYNIYKGLIHPPTPRPVTMTTVATNTFPLTTTLLLTTTATPTKKPTTVTPTSTTQAPVTTTAPPPVIIATTPTVTSPPATTTKTTTTAAFLAPTLTSKRPNKTSRKQNKSTKKGKSHGVSAQPQPSFTTTLPVQTEVTLAAQRTIDTPKLQAGTTTTESTATPSTTIPATTAAATTTSTTNPPPTTTTTATSTTTASLSTMSTTRATPAAGLIIVPKEAVQANHVLQNSSPAHGKTAVVPGALKSGMVAFMVVALAVVTLALAVGGRKAMESFDRRHYTRLELNDLHYEV
uniref:MANSC domain-containing protein n=1 Tax=Oryzias sinensis TaxID=183150 RepID=A0A8C7ZHX1_9TELE